MVTNIGRRQRRASAVTISEDQHQKNIITWAKLHTGSFAELSRLFHIPNGGKRNKLEAIKFKAMGVRPGVPDLCLPVARKGYHALYIELKSETGKTTEKQNDWGEFLQSENNQWVVCKGWVSAAHAIADYLDMPESAKP